jgi:cellulose synthase/poly-beta-1,6-N-acetylglucosamine synthase-like glycosyltransferase
MHLGFTVLSPKECTLTTEVMSSWRALWNQRLRWKRGAMENCAQYGVTKVTWRYWGRQIFTAFGILVTVAYLTSLGWSFAAHGALTVHPFWMAVSAIFVVERIITVKDRGGWRMLLAATMYELGYDIFLQAVHAKAYTDAALGRERRW